MRYLRRLIFAIIILVILSTAWYGAEMLIYGQSQRSIVDLVIAIMISLSISGGIEKGVEINEQKAQYAEKFAEEFVKHLKESAEAQHRTADKE